MPPWKRVVLASASFGVTFALAISAIVGIGMWYKARPRPWNTGAVTGTFGGMQFMTQPAETSYLLAFSA